MSIKMRSKKKKRKRMTKKMNWWKNKMKKKLSYTFITRLVYYTACVCNVLANTGEK